MKNTITILLLCLLSFRGMAQNHYYISATGNDANNGTSTGTPWQTISKVNSTTFAAGDIISFKRGDTFYGTLIPKGAGSSGNPITYGAYGSGAKPIITGFKSVTAWTNLGGNIWESTSSVSSLGSCNMVVINGTNTAMGRWPNTGYNNIDSHSGNTTITSSSLTGTPNWTGAKVAMKRENWYIEVDSITSQSGSTITFTDEGVFPVQTNWGFFIEASPSTLDLQNEWYYNPSTGKLRIYSTTSPTNVQMATLDKTFYNSSNYSYITLDNLAFTGANNMLIDMAFGGHETVSNCDQSFAGIIGYNNNGSTPTVSNNTFNQIGYTAIQIDQNSVNGQIIGNNIKNVYPIAGTKVGAGGSAIYCNMPSGMIKNNVVDSSGWGGINVYGNNDTALNNFVNHSALLRDDCGGLATHHGFTGVCILNNIVLNTVGNPAGTGGGGNILAHGIYLDDLSIGVTVLGNTVANCRGVGMMNHRSHDNIVKNNTFYNNNYSQSNFTKGQIFFQYNDTPGFKNYQIKNNIFFATSANQSLWNYYSSPTNITALNAFGTADSNYYNNVTTGNVFNTYNGGTTANYTLAGWQTYTSQEAHSHNDIYSADSLRFEYNETSSNKTVTLNKKYKDVYGNQYNSGSIVLAPYSSAVLIANGALAGVAAPTISMSGTQNITVDNTSIYAVATPASGHTISSYLWTKTSGPGTTTFGTNTSSSTTVSGLETGRYIFNCRATQDDSQTAYGDVTVNVSISPVITVGQKITLHAHFKFINQ